VLAAVALSVTALTACGDDDDTVEGAQPSTTLASTTTQAPKPIIVKDFTFLNLDVKAGTKVLVQNEGPAAHTLTADNGSFDTGQIAAGANVSFTVPSTPGTYKVKCTIHSTRMTGELKVT
jgi:plastocyanin